MHANDPASARALFDAMRESYRAAPFPDWPTRRGRLERLAALISEHQVELVQAIDADFGGRPAIETRISEIFPSQAEIRGALRHGRGWMKPRRTPAAHWSRPGRAEILPRPLGVIGIIVPWNYPLYLAIGPLVGALAAGNRALLKVSEHSPAFSDLLQRLVAARFGADEVAVVTGGPEVAAAFSALPFDHLVFTGSTTVGRQVMAAASANLTPLTLELGGKSPAVLAPGYDPARAATRILVGKLLNAGQTCVAPDYVLVPRPQLEAFVASAREQAARMYPLGLADPDYCSIVNTRQYHRLLGYLEEADTAGTRKVEVFSGATRDDARHRLAPVLLVDPAPTLAVSTEEIFGPILPVIPYDDVDEALAFIEARPRPLAFYWFDDDTGRTDDALRRVHVGGACINDTLLHVGQGALPFGGVGASGMGHYHGRWGFDSFSKLTPVFRQARLNAMGLLLPPYRPLAKRILALLERYG